jgi:selenocysteine lyase/cysteine desulfurase
VGAQRAAFVDFVGADDPEEIVFGANVTPWVRAAKEAGCRVRTIAVRPDASLDLHARPGARRRTAARLAALQHRGRGRLVLAHLRDLVVASIA